MTEVLATLMPIFWQEGLKRIWATVNSNNDASITLLRTSGFTQSGTSINEVNGKKSEDLEFEITNPNHGEEEGGEEEGGEEGDGGRDDDA